MVSPAMAASPLPSTPSTTFSPPRVALSTPLSLDTSPSSAFRPIAPSAENFFLSAIQTLVVSTSEDGLSESNLSSETGPDDISATQLLCQVCSDKASGFHYGVFACEGCKGFFRRSIQQKIQYRPCSRQQECLIVRNNRNRCQYCRLKKCISVGMSRDAVRFGRVPKREKAKMVEDMQRTTVQSQLDAIAVQFENDSDAIDRIQNAFTQLVITMDSLTLMPLPTKSQIWYSNYMHGLTAMVEFANKIPGFTCVPMGERVQLLKDCIFDVMAIAWSCGQTANTSTTPPSFFFAASSNPLLAQSLLLIARRIRCLSLPCVAVLAALAIIQPLSTTAALSLRLAERLWLLLAKLGGPVALSSAPGLLSDARALGICHSDELRRLQSSPLSPFSIGTSSSSTSSSSQSYRDRHPSIASLLEKPSLLSPAASLKEVKMETDEPLNLCVRDA